jgi:hypothetical protein
MVMKGGVWRSGLQEIISTKSFFNYFLLFFSFLKLNNLTVDICDLLVVFCENMLASLIMDKTSKNLQKKFCICLSLLVFADSHNSR